jgi:molybdate transport system permease protein
MDWTPVWISLKTAIAATAITSVLGILAARWRLGRKGAFAELVDGITLVPLVLPPTVIGLLLLLVLGRQSPVGELLAAAGARIVFTWPATVVAAAVLSFPIVYHTAKAAFAQIDREMMDSARAFGCHGLRLMVRVMLPLAWPGIASGIILAFVRSLGEFGATLMLAGNIPGRTRTIPIAVYSHLEGGETTAAIALSIVTILVSILAITLLARLRRG